MSEPYFPNNYDWHVMARLNHLVEQYDNERKIKSKKKGKRMPTFEDWKSEFEIILIEEQGISLADMDDEDTTDMLKEIFNEKKTPRQAYDELNTLKY